jgi:hypothetical protein
MCLTCDMMLLEEHELSSGPLCPKCHAFHVDPESEGQSCYHCFAAEGGLDPCRICTGSGAELLAELDCDPNFEEEASRIRSVLNNSSKKIN